MGRKRVIGQKAILDAAETVVLREGVVGLTLDAVAKEAGISKASVLYDYKTKDALIAAILERYMQREEEKLAASLQRFKGEEAQALKGRLALLTHNNPEQDRVVCTALSVAMARDKALKAMMQEHVQKDYKAICDGAKNPQGALLSFLALNGLLALEYFDFMRWDNSERQNIIQLIEWAYHQSAVESESGKT